MKASTKSYGFTLIEVLIALVILSVAFLGLAGLMVQTTKNSSFGGRVTEAATLAQDKLEELRAASWVVITPGSDLISIDPNGKVNVKPWVPAKNLTSDKDFSRRWTVNPNGNFDTITITVNWNDKSVHSISLTSLLRNPN